MNTFKAIRPCIGVALSLMALSTFAAQPTEDHQAHHPESPSAAPGSPAPAAVPAPRTAPAAPASTMPMGSAGSGMMCDMHDQMMSAKTPEERRALMQKHMESMSPEMMKQHMQMMQEEMTMMQQQMQKPSMRK